MNFKICVRSKLFDLNYKMKEFPHNKKIRFRFTSQTVPHETQTTFLPVEERKESTVEMMRISDINTILKNEVRPVTTFSKSISQNYNAKLGFYITAVSDPRFEPLTPPKDLYSDISIGIICSLLESSYVLSTPHKHHEISFTYENDDQYISFMKCLETGIITPGTLKFLIQKEWNIKNWDNGNIICKVVDNRILPQTISYIKLEIGPDALELQNFKPISPEGKLDFERRTLLLRHPMICTDPSPDVARVESVIDMRKKMWLSGKPREIERQKQKAQNINKKKLPMTYDSAFANQNQRRKEGTKAISHFTQLRTRIDIPDDLQQKIASMTIQ